MKPNNNIDHERKFVFVHNPKAAGTSFRSWLGLSGKTNHIFPSKSVTKEIWDNYTIIVVVRNPITRLISSYKYHTNPEYLGGIYTKYPDLHSWSIEKYFDVFSTKEKFIIAPQSRYVTHNKSDKKPDFLLKMETLQMSELGEKLNIRGVPTIKNNAQNDVEVELSTALETKIVDFFGEDYVNFDYTPPKKLFFAKYLQRFGINVKI